jgi:hypothetical protein
VVEVAVGVLQEELVRVQEHFAILLQVVSPVVPEDPHHQLEEILQDLLLAHLLLVQLVVTQSH